MCEQTQSLRLRIRYCGRISDKTGLLRPQILLQISRVTSIEHLFCGH